MGRARKGCAGRVTPLIKISQITTLHFSTCDGNWIKDFCMLENLQQFFGKFGPLPWSTFHTQECLSIKAPINLNFLIKKIYITNHIYFHVSENRFYCRWFSCNKSLFFVLHKKEPWECKHHPNWFGYSLVHNQLQGIPTTEFNDLNLFAFIPLIPHQNRLSFDR